MTTFASWEPLVLEYVITYRKGSHYSCTTLSTRVQLIRAWGSPCWIFSPRAIIAWGGNWWAMKHLRFFFTALSGLDLFAVTEPALEVPSLSRSPWKGPALKYPSWTVQLAPGEHPLVSQQLRLVKSQPQWLSCYVHWKDRWIQLAEQHPRLATSKGLPRDQLPYHFCNVQTLHWSKERAFFLPLRSLSSYSQWAITPTAGLCSISIYFPNLAICFLALLSSGSEGDFHFVHEHQTPFLGLLFQ